MTRRTRSLLVAIGLGLLALLAAATAWVIAANLRGEEPLPPTDAATASAPASPVLIARGAYLARAGNCQGCHTVRGGADYAGGRGIATPFGTVHAPNLTPDPEHGLGRWTDAEFWRALHHGRSRDGRLLYPAFPYPNYTRIVRADADALHAYLRSLPAVAQPNRPHELAFPFDRQAALAVWRALYFRPATPEPAGARSAELARGAYLVEGLGHCNACHASRNALGATAGPLDLAGGLIPVQNWYAPSLTSAREAGVADWPDDEVVRLLKTGIGERGAVTGPMSEVVLGSTQHLSDADLRAMTSYLKALPPTDAAARPSVADRDTVLAGAGAALYGRHCVDCHGRRGEGVAGAWPALAGNRAVTMRSAANLVHIVLEGGFAPATAGNPRPYGMPPFATTLSDEEVAQLLSFVRGSWGNRAAAVSTLEVTRLRGAP